MRQGAAIALELVDEPPPPLRVAATGRRDAPARAVRARSEHVAPDSDRAHGTYAKYVVERCRCEPCRRANRDYERRRSRARRDPRTPWLPYVPAEAARRHVADLAAAGVGLKQVARVANLPHGSLSKLVYGEPARGLAPSRRIRRRTHEAIMAVSATAVADGARVPAGPTWRLLDELIARGWTRRYLGSRIAGHEVAELQLSRVTVTARNARAVAALHRELAGQVPPARRTRWSG